MKANRLFPIAIALLVCSATALISFQRKGKQPDVETQATLRMASRLGVEADFVAGQSKVGNLLLDAVLTRYSFRVPLQISEGVYISVPPWDFKEALLTDGQLVVTLINGSTVQGRGLGSIVDKAGRSFGLNTISRLAVVRIDKEYAHYERREKITAALWRLTVGTDATESFSIRQPRFAFKYYSTSGYVMGGSDRTQTGSASIWIKQGTEELETPLEAFATIKLTLGTLKTDPPSLTVTAPNGTTNSGALVLKHHDDRGWHTAHEWGLYGLLHGVDRTYVLATRAPLTLERVQ